MSERVNPHPYRIQLDRVHHELAEALDRVEGREAPQTITTIQERDNS